MNTSPIYIAVTIVVLAGIALIVFIVKKEKPGNRLTPLASLAFGFVLAGIFLGKDQVIGYGLFGVGLILALIDMMMRSRKP